MAYYSDPKNIDNDVSYIFLRLGSQANINTRAELSMLPKWDDDGYDLGEAAVNIMEGAGAQNTSGGAVAETHVRNFMTKWGSTAVVTL